MTNDGTRHLDPSRVEMFEWPRLLFERRPAIANDDLGGRQIAVVVLKVAIDEAGSVREVVVVQSAGPPLDDIAASAIRDSRFSTARLRNGKAVPVRIQYNYVFRRGT